MSALGNGLAPAGIRINLKVSCWTRVRARRAARANAWAKCEWDDVGFNPADGQRFCSESCSASFEAFRALQEQGKKHWFMLDAGDAPRTNQPLDLDSLVQVHTQRRRGRLPTMAQQERRGLNHRSPVDLGPRGLELEMRVGDFFRPFRRRVWVGPNLAVLT